MFTPSIFSFALIEQTDLNPADRSRNHFRKETESSTDESNGDSEDTAEGTISTRLYISMAEIFGILTCWCSFGTYDIHRSLWTVDTKEGRRLGLAFLSLPFPFRLFIDFFLTDS